MYGAAIITMGLAYSGGAQLVLVMIFPIGKIVIPIPYKML